MATHIHIHTGKTKDATLTDAQFKAKVGEINSLLTDASRKCSSAISASGAGSNLEKLEKLEDLVDNARKYAFQIR